MKNESTQKINLADYYYGFLKNLSKESKIDLIVKLTTSLKEEDQDEKTEDIDLLNNLFITQTSEFTAEDIIAEIKALKEARRKETDSASEVF